LRRSTVEQATTLTDLQYQQVLSNLAMFCQNPSAMPWHVNLRDGSAQVADLGALTVGGELTRTSKALPSLLGSRTVVEQWGMTPVTDDTELRLLRIAYRRALGYDESISDHDNELANDLAHELKKQTPDFNEFQDELDRTFADGKTRFRNEQLRALAGAAAHTGWKSPLLFALFGDGARTGDLVADVLFPYKYTLEFYNDSSNPNLRSPARRDGYYGHLEKALSVVSENIILDKYILLEYEGFMNGAPAKIRFDNYIVDQNLKNEYGWQVNLVTPFAAELRRQVKEIQKDVMDIHPGWYHVGRKKDVPKDACYVGHYRDCYVWVCHDGLEDLTQFTIKVLGLSSLIRDPTIFTTPGPRFTPASSFPSL
jgi:hypothetical protein